MAIEHVGLSFLIGAVVGSSFTNSIRNVTSRVTEINDEINTLSRRRIDLRRQLALDNTTERAEELNRELETLGNRIEELTRVRDIRVNMQTNFSQAGAQLSSIKNVVLGGVGAIAGFSAAHDEVKRAQGEIASLGIGTEGIEKITAAARNFSNTWAGATTSEFITASYDIKSGISSLTDEGVAEFTKMAALTGVATKATVKDMTNLFSSAYGAFKSQFGDEKEFASQFSNAISASVQAFKTDGPDLIQAIQSLGGFAVSKGVSLAEELSIIGISKETFGSASEAATSYKAFLNGVGNAEKQLGLQFTDTTGKMLPMADILDKIREKYGDFIDVSEGDELKKAFGSDEAIRIIVDLIGKTDSLRKAQTNLNNEMKKGTITEQMARSMQMGREMQILKQKFLNLADIIGGIFAPAVAFVSVNIGKFTIILSDLINTNKDLVNNIAIITGGFAGLFIVTKLVSAGIYFFRGAMSGALLIGKALQIVLKGLIITMKGLRIAILLLGGALRFLFLSTPIGWIALAIAAIVALYKNWDKVKEIIGQVWDKIKVTFGNLVEYLKGVGLKIKEFFINILNGILDIVTYPIDKIKSGFSEVKSFLGFGENNSFDINKNTTGSFSIVKDVSNSAGTIGQYYGPNGVVTNNTRNMNAPVTYAPNITIQGNASREDIENALMNKQDFEKMMKEYNHNNARLSYGGNY